jgi:hypothetical protein
MAGRCGRLKFGRPRPKVISTTRRRRVPREADAGELGIDVTSPKDACALLDIGKAVTEGEGTGDRAAIARR